MKYTPQHLRGWWYYMRSIATSRRLHHRPHHRHHQLPRIHQNQDPTSRPPLCPPLLMLQRLRRRLPRQRRWRQRRWRQWELPRWLALLHRLHRLHRSHLRRKCHRLHFGSQCTGRRQWCRCDIPCKQTLVSALRVLRPSRAGSEQPRLLPMELEDVQC